MAEVVGLLRGQDFAQLLFHLGWIFGAVGQPQPPGDADAVGVYERFPTLESFAEADIEEVGQYIHSCGFFRGKSRDLVLCAQMLLSPQSSPG